MTTSDSTAAPQALPDDIVAKLNRLERLERTVFGMAGFGAIEGRSQQHIAYNHIVDVITGLDQLAVRQYRNLRAIEDAQRALRRLPFIPLPNHDEAASQVISDVYAALSDSYGTNETALETRAMGAATLKLVDRLSMLGRDEDGKIESALP